MQDLEDLKIIRANMRHGIDCLRSMVAASHDDDKVHHDNLQAAMGECCLFVSLFDLQEVSQEVSLDWAEFKKDFQRFGEVVEEAKALLKLWGNERRDTARLDAAAKYMADNLYPVSMSAMGLLNHIIARISAQASDLRFSGAMFGADQATSLGAAGWEFPWDQAAGQELDQAFFKE